MYQFNYSEKRKELCQFYYATVVLLEDYAISQGVYKKSLIKERNTGGLFYLTKEVAIFCRLAINIVDSIINNEEYLKSFKEKYYKQYSLHECSKKVDDEQN